MAGLKKNIKTTSKSSDTNHLSVVKVGNIPDFVNNCVKNMNYMVALANASSRSAKTAIKKNKDNRYTLDHWKLYLHNCTTYHYFFAKEFLTNIKDGDMILADSCNASITVTNAREWWGEFEGWLNEQGIPNFLSSHMLESDGYLVSSHTK